MQMTSMTAQPHEGGNGNLALHDKPRNQYDEPYNECTLSFHLCGLLDSCIVVDQC